MVRDITKLCLNQTMWARYVRFMNIKNVACHFSNISMDGLLGLMLQENVSIPSEENLVVEPRWKYLTHRRSESISPTLFKVTVHVMAFYKKKKKNCIIRKETYFFMVCFLVLYLTSSPNDFIKIRLAVMTSGFETWLLSFKTELEDICFWPRWSGLDLPSFLKQLGNQATYITKDSFKTLDIVPWRTVVPELWETNKASPTITPAYCLERVSRLRCRERKPR